MKMGGIEDFLENIALEAGKAGLNAVNTRVQQGDKKDDKKDDDKKADASAKKPTSSGIPAWAIVALLILVAMRK